MIVDSPRSLQAVGGAADAAALAPLADHPEAPGAAFAGGLWAACAVPGPAWRVAAAAPHGLQAEGWREILVCEQVGVSPYTALREVTAAGGGLPGPVACLTLGGPGLQGQHGRAWRAEPGNLHLSAALPCDLDAALCGPSLPMLAAVVLCEAVEHLAGREAAREAGLAVKWINDVVLADGKLGGVLTAMRTRGGRVTEVFAGVALNVARAPQLAPDPFALPSVSLAAVMTPPSLAAVASAVLAGLRARLETLSTCGPAGLCEAYRARSLVVGREVGIWDAALRGHLPAGSAPADLPPPTRRGLVVEVLPDLSLLLAGQDEPVRTGCLRLLDGSGSAAFPH
jgi:BirA family biotin operon repressor/biotin-[acetyl-CoA-carboxylase] ligase